MNLKKKLIRMICCVLCTCSLYMKNIILVSDAIFQRSFLTVDGKKIEVGTKGNGENTIVILHAYGNIPPLNLDIEIPEGKTEIPEEYQKYISELDEKSISYNSNYIEDFEKLSDELAKKYKVVVIHRLGYGQSDDTKEERTVEKIAEEIHKVIKQLNLKKPLLFAHSMGGLFALSYIQRYSDDIMGYVGLDACTPAMFLEEELCSQEPEFNSSWFEKILNLIRLAISKIKSLFSMQSSGLRHDPKTTNWGSEAIVNECNEQLDNARKLENFKFPNQLNALMILSTFSSRYMEGQLLKGVYKSSLKQMNEKLISNPERQEIIEIEGSHFLYHKNFRILAEKIDYIAEKSKY